MSTKTSEPAHSALGLTVLTALALPLVLPLFFVPYYAVNDNTFFAMILRGVGFVEAPSEWTVHLNLLLGKALKALYVFFPSVAWYPLFLSMVLTLTLWVFASTVLPNNSGKTKKAFAILVLYGVFFRFFLFLDWTSTSLLAAMAGAWGISLSLSRDSDPKPGIAGILLIGLSALLRNETTLPGLLVAAPLLWKAWRDAPANKRRPLLKPALALLVLVAIPIVVNETTLARHPEWKDALRYAKLREVFVEFKDVHYDAKTEPVFHEAGWDKSDYDLFRTWYAGVGKFSLDNLDFLNRTLKGFTPRDPGHLKAALLQPSFGYFSLLFLILLALVPGPARPRLLVTYLGSLLLLCPLLLFAKIPDRVIGPFLALSVLATVRVLFDQDTADRRKGRRLRMLAVAGCIAVIANSLWMTSIMDGVFRDREAGFRQALKDLPKGRDRLLVFWGNGIHVDWVRAFDDQEEFKELNLYPVFWLQTSPHAEAMRKRFGLEDPVRDLVDRPDVSLAPSDLLSWDFYQCYMKDKHGKDVTAVKVSEGMGCKVYRVVTDKSKIQNRK